MTYTYNLIDQPWIPCVSPDGIVKGYTLREVLSRSHDLRAVVGDTPLETASIYRLLLAVLHSALRGPATAREWHKIWQDASLDRPWLHDYLDQWKHRFDLFDKDHPFYQARDERAKPKSVISLVMNMVAGNNASLFDHHTEEDGAVLDVPKAARSLITGMTFGLAGLTGMEQKNTDCPWSRGIVFLLNGATLFEILTLNLSTSIVQKRIPITGQDQPSWEMDDPFTPERKIPFGYLDYLTWQNRRLLLIPEGDECCPTVSQFMTAPALRLDPEILDPMKHYRVDDKLGNLVLRFNEDRALWRDSAALMKLHNPVSARPPENFNAVASLALDYGYIPSSSMLQYLALGMANNKAKIEFIRQENLPLPIAYLQDDEIIGLLTDCLVQAERINQVIARAGLILGLGLIKPGEIDKPLEKLSKETKDNLRALTSHWGSDRVYWSALELPFMKLLENLPVQIEKAVLDWRKDLKQSAWAAIDYAVQQAAETPAVYKSTVHAHSYLGNKIKEILVEDQQEAIA